MKLLKSKKAVEQTTLFVALISIFMGIIIALPFLTLAANSISNSADNFSSAENAILSLTPLVLIISIVLFALTMIGIKLFVKK